MFKQYSLYGCVHNAVRNTDTYIALNVVMRTIRNCVKNGSHKVALVSTLAELLCCNVSEFYKQVRASLANKQTDWTEPLYCLNFFQPPIFFF
jgi:hypothetical protein